VSPSPREMFEQTIKGLELFGFFLYFMQLFSEI